MMLVTQLLEDLRKAQATEEKRRDLLEKALKVIHEEAKITLLTASLIREIKEELGDA